MDRVSPSGTDGHRLLTVAGIPVYVARSSYVVAAVLAFLYAPRVENEVPGIGRWALVVAALFAVLLYASVLLHEIAHSLVSLRLGLPVRRMRLDLFGGFSETATAPTPGREALVVVSGPLTNVALFGVGMLMLQAVPGGSVARVLVGELTVANASLAVFNLLPALPLDGGRLLAAAIWRGTGNRSGGQQVAAHAGRVLAVGIAVVFLGLPLLHGRRPTVASFLFAAVIASFMWSNATQALNGARVRGRVGGLVAGSLMRPAIAVPAGSRLTDVQTQVRVSGRRMVVVVDALGVPVGVVDDAAVAAVPAERWPWLDVTAVSRRVEPTQVLGATLAGDELIAALTTAPAGAYPILGAGGRVLGVLVAADVEAALARR